MKTTLKIDVNSAGALIRYHRKNGVISPGGYHELDQYNEERHKIVMLQLKTKTIVTFERVAKLLFVWAIVENENYEGYLTVKEVVRIPDFQLFAVMGPHDGP